MLRTEDLDYTLPESAIATRAAEPRDSARLMVVSRATGDVLEHAHVRDLPRHLRPSDLLVFNTTRVAPARLLGVRADTGGKVTGLYLGAAPGEMRWVALLGGARLREGVTVRLMDEHGSDRGVSLKLLNRSTDEPGAWVVEVARATSTDQKAPLEAAGLTPLPPYILQARKHAGDHVPDEADRARYQTVFAEGEAASVAAPTAGLHFTPELLARLGSQGVEQGQVVLHVGTGTFRTVETEIVEQHPMHSERCRLGAGLANRIREARAKGGRVVCVGTTSARTVESFAAAASRGEDISGWLDTRLLITPGYRWNWTDGLLTNFHLPRSTLMAMVSALLPGGVEQLKELYAQAIERGYRFYSYGDAMLILP